MKTLNIDDIFNFTDSFGLVAANNKSGLARSPVYDIIETDKGFLLEIHLGGVKKDDIIISVEDGILSVEAERKNISDLSYNRKESYYGKYKRTYKLPPNVGEDDIDASLSHGILKIEIPKKVEKTKSSKITIKIK